MLDKRIYWIWLVLVFGAANPRIWQLSEKYSNAEDFVRALKNGTVANLTENENKNIKKYSIKDAEAILQYCKDKGINVYCYESEGYPHKLKGIANPPSVLFCLGNLDFLNDKICVAIVGTRKPSEYSADTTRKLCEQLADRGILLASGFAMGIDRIANEVSLERQVKSVAVSGAAIEDDYPKGSSELKEQVCKNGVVISEYCSEIKPNKSSFVHRNRILTGLSDGVVFCECSADSKGLDNVRHAAVQGKPIFVLPPHDVFDPRYFGQRDLIRNGATAVFGGVDISTNLAYTRLESIRLPEDFKLASDTSAELLEKPKKKSRRRLFNKKAKKKNDDVAKPKIDIDLSSLDENKQKICKALESGNLIVDEIVKQTGIDISSVLNDLIELEIEGIITAYPGKVYGITK